MKNAALIGSRAKKIRQCGTESLETSKNCNSLSLGEEDRKTGVERRGGCGMCVYRCVNVVQQIPSTFEGPHQVFLVRKVDGRLKQREKLYRCGEDVRGEMKETATRANEWLHFPFLIEI